jgi:hypothetical protein
MIPVVRNDQATSVARRVSSSQPSPTRPVIRAATAKLKGIVIPTYPR